jgi:hypothetical protein
MIDWTKPIQTRDGRPARYLGSLKGCDTHVVAIACNDNWERETTELVDDAGEAKFSGCGDGVVNAPSKLRGWMNIYESVSSLCPFTLDTVYHDEDDAHRNAGPGRIACVRVEFEEGEGL